jgi:Na+-driven multidrug efflux pump/anti-sigma regulatory factor (Ser/Thr protein kinase)
MVEMYARNQLLVTHKFREYLLSALLMSSAVSLATVVDSIIVGRLLGSVALSAVGLTAPVIYGLNLLHLLFSVGGLTTASIVKGRRDHKTADQLFTVSLITGLICISLYALGIILLAEPLSVALSRGNALVQDQVLDYLRPLVLAGLPLSFSFGLAQFHRVDGNPRASAVVALTANAVNLVLDYVLIRYAGMGIAGAGLSTTLGYLAGAILVLPYLFSKKRSFHFVWPGKKLRSRLGDVIRVGLPKGLNQGTSLLRSAVLNSLIMATLGSPGMAAMAVCINALAITAIFITSSSDAMLPIVGTLYGEGDALGMRATAKTASRVILLASSLMAAFFLAWPRLVGGWFGIVSPQDLDVMVPALRMFALSLPLYSINILLQNFYATTGREKIASFMATLDGLVFVVLFAFILVRVDLRLFWLCYLFSELATLTFALLTGRQLRRKEPLSGILLIKEEEAGALWEVSIPAEVEAAVGVSEQVIAFGRQNGLPPVLSNRIGIAIEEMAVNTAIHGKAKNRNTRLDIRVRLTDDQVIISLRDNGIPFDPSLAPKQEESSLAYGGIEIARRIASKFEYSHHLGFNATVLAFDR